LPNTICNKTLKSVVKYLSTCSLNLKLKVKLGTCFTCLHIFLYNTLLKQVKRMSIFYWFEKVLIRWMLQGVLQQKT